MPRGVVCLSVDWDQKLRTQTRLQRINVSTFSTSAISSEQDAFRPLIAAMPQNNVSDLLTAGFGALILLNIGVVICGSSGEMLVANDSVQEIIRARDGLELDAIDVLCPACHRLFSIAVVIR